MRIFRVKLATTTAAIEKGLSDRLSLNPDSGMLFIFAKPAIYRFWMPDMHFPLNMIWIKKGGRRYQPKRDYDVQPRRANFLYSKNTSRGCA